MKEDYAKLIGQNVEQMKQATAASKQTENMIKRQNEINEAESRRNNAILYGLIETNNCPVIEQVNEFMKKECFKFLNKPVAAIRLGDKNKDDGKPRPIKVIFESEPSKWEFVKRVNSGPMKKEKIFCKIDVSQEVRNKEWTLREEIRNKKKRRKATTQPSE